MRLREHQIIDFRCRFTFERVIVELAVPLVLNTLYVLLSCLRRISEGPITEVTVVPFSHHTLLIEVIHSKRFSARPLAW